jgi:hypothetical protein
MRSLDYSLRSPRRGGSEEVSEAGGYAGRNRSTSARCACRARACRRGPGHHTPNVVACQKSSGVQRRNHGTARIAGKRWVKRLGKVAGGIPLALGSVGGLPAIGQTIGTDDDKPVVVVVQQDQPAGQERPADQPTVGVQALGPCVGRQARSGREGYLVPLSARRSVGVMAGRVTDRDSIEWNTPGSTEIRALIGGK